ncbi:MAG: conserved membrane protein of unknown function [Promethearchaeota archaeon]|nr:MAG: conserved membrane protein of unknown function [Candidatus Lokiarchaeota archaeon]
MTSQDANYNYKKKQEKEAFGADGRFQAIKNNWKLVIFLGWTIITFLLILSGDAQSFFAGIGVLISALSTLIFWIFRTKLPFKGKEEKSTIRWKYIFLGSMGAFWVELEFWILEKLTGVRLAADSNLIINMVVMMPWYVAMIATLWYVSNKYEYSYFEILLLGGIYDFCADGIIGSLFSGQFSLGTLLLLIIIFPQFVLCYSFMVIPATYYLKIQEFEIHTKKNFNKYIWALLPLIVLFIWTLSINIYSGIILTI